jgi:hypothetical protein
MPQANWRGFLRLSPVFLPDLSFARDDAHEIRPPASAVNKLTSNIRSLNYQFSSAFDAGSVILLNQ